MQSWITSAVARLAACRNWSYAASPVVATEPTALAALALLTHNRFEAARPPLDWLAARQKPNGSLGVTAELEEPGWATSLAIVAWTAADNLLETARYRDCRQRGGQWLLETSGTTPPRAPHVGHDTTIEAWPWVVGTHAWVEPTAFAWIALKALGLADHPRAVSAQRMLIDRLLPHGGCNYGNTVVLGQELLAHVQTTGIALLAIDRAADDPRVALSLKYLQQNLPGVRTASSLSFGLLGLLSHVDHAPRSEAWLAKTYATTVQRGASPHALALLALAAAGERRPLDPRNARVASL